MSVGKGSIESLYGDWEVKVFEHLRHVVPTGELSIMAEKVMVEK